MNITTASGSTSVVVQASQVNNEMTVDQLIDRLGRLRLTENSALVRELRRPIRLQLANHSCSLTGYDVVHANSGGYAFAGREGVARVAAQSGSAAELRVEPYSYQSPSGIAFAESHGDAVSPILEHYGFPPEIAAIVKSWMAIDWSAITLPPHVQKAVGKDTLREVTDTFAEECLPVILPERMYSQERTVVRLEDTTKLSYLPFYEWTRDMTGKQINITRPYCTFSFTHDPDAQSPALQTVTNGYTLLGDFGRFSDFVGHYKQQNYEQSVTVPIESAPTMRASWNRGNGDADALAHMVLNNPDAAIAEIMKRQVTSFYIGGAVVRHDQESVDTEPPGHFEPSPEDSLCIHLLTVPINFRHAQFLPQATLAERQKEWIRRVEAVVNRLLGALGGDATATAAAGTKPAESGGGAASFA